MDKDFKERRIAFYKERQKWHQRQVQDKMERARRLQQEVEALQDQLYKHEGAMVELGIVLEDLEKVATQEEKSLAGGDESPAPDPNIISLP